MTDEQVLALQALRSALEDCSKVGVVIDSDLDHIAIYIERTKCWSAITVVNAETVGEFIEKFA